MYKRKILTLIIICCCFLSGFAMTPVIAATTSQENISENEMAVRLSKLGMITGNEKGDYMLQAKLKRSEAVQFIVNLTGKNKYVKDNKDTYSATSFNDVKKTDWFAPSVGYCEQNGYITVNDTATFRPKDYVSEKEFLGMVLKGLGYTTSDFSWSTVFQKAYEIGLVSDSVYQTKTEDDNKQFDRGSVVSVMYTALGLKTKSDNMTLLQKMVNAGEMSYETAISSKIMEDEVVSKIIEIKPLNEQKLKVVFNEKIGIIDPESIQINDATNGNTLSISSISQTDTELIIKTSKQVAARNYSIEINKFVDFDGNTIPKVTGTFTGFRIVEVVSDLFKISKIEQKDEHEVNVYFTHPVNDNAVNSNYYQIFENESPFVSASIADTSIKLLPNNKGLTIGLKGKKFTADQEYSIKVSPEMISAYGVNFVAQTELDTFIARDVQSTGFAVEMITGLSRSTIQVDFTMDVDPQIAQQIYMYSITDSTNKQIAVTSAQVVSSAAKSVILTINGTLDSAKTYNLMVNYMPDATSQYTINKKSYSFEGYISGGIEFQIYGAVPVDAGSVTVTFSKPLSTKAISDTSNFTLLDNNNSAYKASPTKIIVSSEDPNTIRLFFSNDKKLQKNRTYTLKVSTKVTDYTGYSLTGQSDYVFDSYDIADTSITAEKAVIIGSDTLKVVFNREMAMDTPNIFTGNYSIEYYDNGTLVKKVPIAITYIDSKIIVLKFDKLPEGVDCTFNYKEIKDIGGEIYSDSQSNTIKVTVAT
ncbi:Ig-like domain-containing protein [Ruminiclostridium cellobioparum]|uniref:Ig-like domain-containing protein n=1 Tax=Ruminiclostridium cellobioparum TaxID=29355 RepID=UPI00048239CA|nr:Ig-like domain-containing protein [Ruminiclostridium cellobioparum]